MRIGRKCLHVLKASFTFVQKQMMEGEKKNKNQDLEENVL